MPSETTLGQALAGCSRRAGPPSPETRRRRERLVAFLREVEPRVLGEAAGPEARRALGWDDESLAAFVESDLVVHSSPHASMNAFAPMFAFPWVCRTIGVSSDARRPVHLRTQITHNNVSDTRWRPYAWWHREPGGAVGRISFFRRTPQRRQVLLAQPVPSIPLDECDAEDAAAVAVAEGATNFASFCLVYRSLVERRAGIDWPGRTVEVPAEVLTAFLLREEGIELAAKIAGPVELSVRAIEHGELVEVGPAEVGAHDPDRLVLPIAALMAGVYRLGADVVVGAEKMAAYLPEANEAADRILGRENGDHPPLVSIARLPGVAELLPLDAPSLARLEETGAAPSLPIWAADYGTDVARRLDTLLGRPWKEFSPEKEAAYAAAVR